MTLRSWKAGRIVMMETASVSPIDLARVVEGRWYLRPREAVALTGLAKSVVYDALASGELQGYRRGRSWLIPVVALRAWIEGRTGDAPDQDAA